MFLLIFIHSHLHSLLHSPFVALHMWKLKLREIYRLGWGHSDPKSLSKDSNSGMLDSTMKYAFRFKTPKSLCSLTTQKDKPLSKLKMKMPKFLSFHTIWPTPSWQEAHVCNTLGSFPWDLWGGHFLIFSAWVATVKLSFYIFLHKKNPSNNTKTETNAPNDGDRFYSKLFSKWHIASISNQDNKSDQQL